MGKHPLLAFLLITFGLSWGVAAVASLISTPGEGLNVTLAQYTPLYYLVVWAPALAALFVIGMTQGTTGLRSYTRRLLIHWLVNFPYPWEGEADTMTAQVLVLSLAAIVLAIFTRARYLGSNSLYTDVAPGVQ
jgi:hypothetical protein